ncbi:MAG: ATP-binding protein, partial [Arcobacteraceae bacterium]
NGYIFIVDKNGDFLINIKESLLWRNQINLQDKNGEDIVKKILETEGEGYISYFGIEGTHTSQSKKISYIKHYVPFGWAIGYGFHPSDIQSRIDQKVVELKKEHQSYLFKFIIVTVCITVGLIILLLLLSKRIEKIFRNYKEEIAQKENENRQKNEIIYQQSKMTVIGELLNMISHQWRQPLSQINAITLNMYLEHKEGLLDEKVLKKNIGDIENTTQYLSQTIDDFSHFFIQESKEKVFLVNDSIDHCISILNPSLHHINLQLDFQSKKYLNGYITLFQQTVLSMISNSMNIFNVNNISDPQISISTYDEKNFVFIEISDNGGGIPQNTITKIFDLYFSTKKQATQSGLGLYIVKEIIEKNFHGKIKVANVDNGVKFTIRIECFDIK